MSNKYTINTALKRHHMNMTMKTKLPMLTLTWHMSKYKVYIKSIKATTPSGEKKKKKRNKSETRMTASDLK